MLRKKQRRAEHREALKDRYRQAILTHWAAKTEGVHEEEVARLAETVVQLKLELAATDER
jgi:hypothetical protein